MTCFIGAHLIDDGPRAPIVMRQFFEMTVEVVDHLALGFGNEAKTRSIAGQAGQCADGK